MIVEKAAAPDRVKSQLIVLTILFLAAYFVPLKAMVNIWQNDADYSYGFLVPLTSAYLFWEKRKILKNITVRSSWTLLPPLVFFVLLSLYAILGSSGYISMPSVPILILLFTGFCFGIESVKKLILPLGYLVFMVPVPPVIERHAGLYLKTLSSNWGGAFIRLFDIPVLVNGNIIDLGVTRLQVIDACSGMRYLLPLVAIGVLYAYLFERTGWKRLLCIFVTIPTGILFNVLRIGITGILTNEFGPGVSKGFFHDFSGWVIFVFALIVLFLVSRFLAVFFPDSGRGKAPVSPKPETASLHIEHKKTTGAFFISAAALGIVAFITLRTDAMPPVIIKGGIESFPLRIGEWEGVSKPVDPVLIRASGAEEAFMGFYGKEGSDALISVYMGYRRSAFLSNENYFHTPTVCIPSAGWIERSVKKRTVTNVPLFNDLEVMEMLIEKEGSLQLVYFWFQTKDRATPDKNINRLHLSLSAIRRENTHALFIRPITPISSSESIEAAEKRMDRFVREMMTVLLQFLKEKQVTEDFTNDHKEGI